MTLPMSKEKINLGDLEKSSGTFSPSSTRTAQEHHHHHLHPSSKHILKKLYSAMLIEAAISITIYYNYSRIASVYPMVAPTLLGCSTAALAQSINQFSRKKFTLNKIFKFMVWGCINGYFTVAWINVLMVNFDNLFLRILVDQLVGSPTFQLVFNVLSTIWDQGEVFSINAYIKSLKYSFCFWPIFSTISFTFIPQGLMFPCNCLASLIWNIILSKLG
ncbi:uncharacterized protein LODBEIA_P42330 [Lodderomyces beijingensis]|uniref:Uncharacterized protein n=1 Tax=Lodderomyces beijingensis TaxID=1775926 RepID=A0ABP0ZQ14_9ASCO